MRRTIPFLLLLLLAACASYRQNDAAGDIDRFASTVLREIPDLPSAGVAVVKDGRTVYLREPNTGYYIGSTTKAYTGLAMAILANRGLVDLDAPVSRYLPETNVSVTLRAFLTHTSGIENNPIVYRTAYTGEHTPQQLVALLNQSKPRAKPGFAYDNLGYVVASMVMERVTGRPWQQELDELVFKPAGMKHTSAYMSVAKTWPMAQPWFRNRSGNVERLKFEKIDQTMHAAGGIVTTPSDLARWLEANLGYVAAIPAAARNEAQRLQVQTPLDRGEFKGTGYAFGWYHGDFHGEHVLFHGGGYEGWHSWYALLPEKHIGAAALTNINGAMSDGADLIVAYALDRLLEKPGLEAEYAKKLATLKERVAKIRQNLIDDVAKRAQRPWSLTHPNEAYVGRYENPGFGTLTIEQREGKLYASIGRLSSLIEAFTKPETARVELTPGTGEPLAFKWSSGDKPDVVVWDEDEFVRVR